MSIPVTRSSMPDFDEFIEEIRDLWDSRWLTNMGPKHKQLEEELKSYLKVAHVSLFSNGHLALENAIAAFDLTGEVITTPFTFASTTQAIVRNGLTPVFCDINMHNYTIDTKKIEKLITDKTSAIIAVHVYGNICNVEEIERVAKKHNLKVIYDAAHAFGIDIEGKGIANFGDASMFSFHATKVFNTIEGGAITFKDPSIISKLNALKNFGITSLEDVKYVAGNAKMNEFQAAMGICNLRYVEEEINKRQKVFNRYINNLSCVEGIKIPKDQVDIRNNYAYFPVVFENYKLTRNEVLEELKENHIFARKYFYPLTNSFECYKGEFSLQQTPVAEYIADRVLTLPLYADLALEDVDKICEIIKR